MPFVAYLKEQANAKGSSALNSTLDFNEFDTLNINNKYLVNTLQVSNINNKKKKFKILQNYL